MTKEYVKYFLFIVPCLIVICRTAAAETCSSQVKKCADDAKIARGISQEDITRILNEWRRTRKVSKEDNVKLCKYNTDLHACYLKMVAQCRNDISLKVELSATERIEDLFSCPDGQTDDEGDCHKKMETCVAIGTIFGKIALSQYERIERDQGKRKYFTAQIGRVNGCNFVDAFTDCYDLIKDKCANNPKPIVDATEAIRTQFKCGQSDDGITTECEAPLNKCKSETMDESLQGEIDAIIWILPGMEVLDYVNEIGKYRGCKFVKNFQDCHDKVKKQCGENDLYFKAILDITKLVKNGFKCDCFDQLNKCKDQGMSISKVTSNEIDAIMPPVANPVEEIAKIGQERGCKFVNVFNACHDEIKSQCGLDEQNFRPVLERTKLAHDQLKCSQFEEDICQQEINKCISDALSDSGLSEEEIGKMQQGDFSDIMHKVGEFDICKFLEDFRECNAKFETQCDTNMKVETFKLAESAFQCDQPGGAKCIQKLGKCGTQALIDSGANAEDLKKIKTPTGSPMNPHDILTELGKNKGCDYLKSLRDCTETAANDECKAISSIRKSVEELIKLYDGAKCGCASPVASLALIISSIFVFFFRKSVL